MATKKQDNTPVVDDNAAINATFDTPDNATTADAALETELAKLKSEIAALNEALAAKNAEAPVTPQPLQREPMETIRLFKDSGKYKDDVFVAINGRAYQIKRGEPVQVPKSVADLLDQSQRQDNATTDLITRESERYEAEARARNLL